MDEKLDVVRAAAGDKFDELELQVQIFKTVVTDQPKEVAEQIAPAFGLPPDVMLNAPFFQIGTVEQITESIQEMRERWGISYVLFQTDGIVPMGPVVSRLAGPDGGRPTRHQIGGAVGRASVPTPAARCWITDR